MAMATTSFKDGFSSIAAFFGSILKVSPPPKADATAASGSTRVASSSLPMAATSFKDGFSSTAAFFDSILKVSPPPKADATAAFRLRRTATGRGSSCEPPPARASCLVKAPDGLPTGAAPLETFLAGTTAFTKELFKAVAAPPKADVFPFAFPVEAVLAGTPASTPCGTRSTI